ncbi:MAG: succinylglutamate desuccinylase/aspartoacylase family protein [Candidatus Kerfeldbacteria bacterium]
MKKRIIKVEKVNIERWEIGQGKVKILITAGIHGDEHSQQLVIKQLLKKVNDRLPLTLVILPRLNPLGLKKNCEENPTDKLNMNRIFPGSPNSKYISKRIADLVMQEAKKCNAIIDLHNFSDPALPQTIFINTGNKKIKRESLKLCKLFNLPIIWKINPKSKSISNIHKTLIFNTINIGIPSVGAELPPLDHLLSSQVSESVQGINNIIKHLLKQKIKNKNKGRVFLRQNIRAKSKGSFKQLVSLGISIKKNQTIGIIKTKKEILKINSPVSGQIVRIKLSGPVKKNELLINIAKK